MIKIRQFTLLLGVLILTSCSTTKLLTSTVKPYEITNLQKFETLSYISLIERGNQGKYNDTLSYKSKTLFSGVLDTFENNIRLTGDIFVYDLLTKQKIEKEIEYLCKTADLRKSIANLKIPRTLDSLLETSQNRFGLITVTTGFTRVKGNYGKQVAKGVGLGILTLGMVYGSPIKAQSTVYVAIIDSKDNNIAFFRKSFLQDKEPLNEVVLRKQLENIFEGYFWTSNPYAQSN